MKKVTRVGEKYITKKGYEIEITEYFSCKDCTIKFLIDNTEVRNVPFSQIKSGYVKYKNERTMASKGFLGLGDYNATNNSNLYYRTWASIFQRTYKNKKDKQFILCEEWHEYQNFANWYKANHKRGYVLNTGFLNSTNVTIFSPETCCFLPYKLHAIFRETKDNGYPLGVYFKGHGNYLCQLNGRYLGVTETVEQGEKLVMENKKKYLIKLAKKYRRTVGEDLYNKLINYEFPKFENNLQQQKFRQLEEERLREKDKQRKLKCKQN